MGYPELKLIIFLRASPEYDAIYVLKVMSSRETKLIRIFCCFITVLPSIDAGEIDPRVVDDTTIDVEAQGPVKFSVGFLLLRSTMNLFMICWSLVRWEKEERGLSSG